MADHIASRVDVAPAWLGEIGGAPRPGADAPARVLVISYGEFSGIRRRLLDSLRGHGCEVVEVTHSLRYLRFRYFYIALMTANALLVYGWRFRRYINRTWAAQWARARANQEAVARHDAIDAVLSLSPMPNHTHRQPGIRYAIFTDHVNLLSKQSPDFGLPFPERRVSSAWNRYESRSLQSQDLVFVPSAYVKRSVVDDYGVAAERVIMVGAGANLDVDCERDGVAKDYQARNVLFVGLDPLRKGLPQLLEAFAWVVEVFPDARLDVAGVTGTSTANVHYHGRVVGDRLKAMFYQAQIFAMPTLREPFGIVFLEAMWAKAVCIGTNAFAIPEFIEDGTTGYLVEPQDTDRLAQRIIELFNNPARLQSMAEAAYASARASWSWERSARQMLDALLGANAAPDEPAAIVPWKRFA